MADFSAYFISNENQQTNSNCALKSVFSAKGVHLVSLKKPTHAV